MYRSLLSFTTTDYDVRPNQILEDDFTTEEEIQEFLRIGYIVEYDGTLEITENGKYDVEDYQIADVNVPSGEPTLQEKSVTITSNTTTTINPDSNYDGLSSVAVSVNVGGTKPLLPEGIQFRGNAKDYSWLDALDFSGITNMSYTFRQSSIEELPLIDTSNVVNMRSAFYSCQDLKKIAQIDTSNVTDMYEMFKVCRKLTDLPILNTSSLTSYGMNYMFDNAGVWQDDEHPNGYITDESLNNILQMCINTPQMATKTLQVIGLNSGQATRCQSLSNWDAFVQAGWSTGY